MLYVVRSGGWRLFTCLGVDADRVAGVSALLLLGSARGPWGCLSFLFAGIVHSVLSVGVVWQGTQHGCVLHIVC